ncbi:MAG: glycosyltransferase family 4 protein [Ruminococcus sp.]|nr:glycosyltransferase family 4 protein [Ruminococcus sp.]
MSKTKKALMLASVASMIVQFNEDNIQILNSLGYQVDVAANFDFGSALSQERIDDYKITLHNRGTNVYNLPIPRSIFSVNNIVRSYKEIKSIVNQNDYDIVHCHSPIGGVLCRLSCRKARKNGTKVIYTAHGFHFFKGASKLAWAIYYPIEKFCSRFTDVLITINKEDFERAKNFKSKKVEYVPGIGVHTEEFRNVNCAREDIRKEFGFKTDDIVFMSVGQLSVRKNHEVAIRALAKIKNDKIKYLLVGFGELEDYLKKLVNELGLENRVVFAGYRGDVKQLLHSVDAFVFPSLQEGLPVSLMEAMSVGLPVVCSRIRGNTDLLEGSRGGYMYDCYDVEGFAQGMEKIAYGETLSMGQVNIDTMKKFDIEKVNSEMLRIYSQISKQ